MTKKKYEISVDPRILELLGPNLYTNIYYVLAELIANAYDAEAHNVYVIVGSDEIRVEDDGKGMSYKKNEIADYLTVAKESRTGPDNSSTPNLNRPKMGRKGVGKLAALSVSEKVTILTVSGSERSGFILTRRPINGNELEAIPDEQVSLSMVEGNGTAVVMRDPKYKLHKTTATVKRNLLRMFPMVNQDFKIHICIGSQQEVIDSFDRGIMTELGALITLGDSFHHLAKHVRCADDSQRKELVVAREPYRKLLSLTDNYGAEKEYTLEVCGWIGAYASTKGRKSQVSDFPDNFVSLFANGKLGEFNILPVVGQNKLNEVYVVGQLHVDLFESSELPDMALSNRQGYKSDDPRYIALLGYVRDELLPEVLKKRTLYADFKEAGNKRKKLQEEERAEKDLRENVEQFRKKVTESAASRISGEVPGIAEETISKILKEELNRHSLEVGLKAKVDSLKKKILISHTFADKALADVIFEMLCFNNVPLGDILYTSCDYGVCRIPEGTSIFDYLREFFVNSYSDQKMTVFFVTSDKMALSWGAVTEVGASWITQVDHKIFNIDPYCPRAPLNDQAQWHSSKRDSDSGELSMDKLNADVFCQKIEDVCDRLKYRKKSRKDNLDHLGKLLSILPS